MSEFGILYDMEKDIENDLAAVSRKNPLWGKGQCKRVDMLCCTIRKFDRILARLSESDLEFDRYVNSIGGHLLKALYYYEHPIWHWDDYQTFLVEQHRYLTLAFFAQILFASDKKKIYLSANKYLDNLRMKTGLGPGFFREFRQMICKVAEDCGITDAETMLNRLQRIRRSR